MLREKYINTFWGYSVHALLTYDNKIIGGYSAVVEKILYRKTPLLFACGCDAMIQREFRNDLTAMARLHKMLIEYMKGHNVVGFIGETHQQLLEYLQQQLVHWTSSN